MNINRFSVIIRVKNEEQFIGFCIQSLLDHLINPEIIILNNESTDNTIGIIEHFKRNEKLLNENKNYGEIKIFNIPHYTPGLALNLGISKSCSKYIMIISAHCKLISFNENYSITNLKKHCAIFGKQIPIWNGKRIKPKYVWDSFIDEEIVNMYSNQEKRYFFHNAFSIFKKETLVNYPFDESLVGKEDRYWSNEQINSGKTILYDPTNKVEHYYTSNGATWKNI